ncbi:intein-containing Rv2578c family radical SAM protein [Amycolatopsis sp.]|uniref:intein-containing Rv2578c family radical SAM protein n=1 Tax=Amycolatopsis sp. TaxID=37632 RepID=UPI00262DAB83|nr:intein-containing Rv2578c family radical SAM protein [Amycolatopsis sp.]
MRWDRQRTDDRSEQALVQLDGLVRSVRSPEFDDVTFHEVHAKSVLNKVTGSPMPFGWTVNPYRGCSHACTYCLDGSTEILMADGRTKPLADVVVGDEVYGTEQEGSRRRYTRTRVLAHWSSVKHAYRVVLEDGTELIGSGEHRFLTDRGWKHVTGGHGAGSPQRPHLLPGTKIVGTGRFARPPHRDPEYRAGYVSGMVKGEGSAEPEASDRSREFLAGFRTLSDASEPPISPSRSWQKGFLAGVFDASGSYTREVLRVASVDDAASEVVADALRGFGFRHTIGDYERATGARTVRLLGGLGEQLRFLHTVDPAITRKRVIDGTALRATSRVGVVSVEPLGIELPLFDITTGTGDFIANGMVSHNCFARNTHTYLDFDAGKDFDTQVVVKVNAPEVLAAQLRKPSWKREHVAMGTNTDPYQRAEGRYKLMPRIIRALADSGTPFSILTKGTVLTRDLPLLSSVAKDVPVGLGVSIALLDRELQHRLEPGTPSPQARLDLVRRARDAGLPCGVFVAPILPGLTDSTNSLDELLTAIADAGATGVTVVPLHLRPGTREWFAQWLAEDYPGLVPLYREIYGKGAYASKEYRAELSGRVGRLLRKHGLDRGSRETPRGIPGDNSGGNPGGRLDDDASGWPAGSFPLPRTPAESTRNATEGDQLRLL